MGSEAQQGAAEEGPASLSVSVPSTLLRPIEDSLQWTLIIQIKIVVFKVQEAQEEEVKARLPLNF